MASWIFQGNPKVFNINEYLRRNNIIYWGIRQKHFAKDIKIGDHAFIWRSEARKKDTGDVIAHGVIVDKPRILEAFDCKDLYKDPERAKPTLRVKIALNNTSLEKPRILRNFMKSDPILSSLDILRMSQSTTFKLNDRQSNQLYELYYKISGVTKTDNEQDEMEFPEGKVEYRLHVSRERNSKIVREAKRLALEKYKSLFLSNM